MAKYVVARLGEIAPGAHKIVEVKDRVIGVFNVSGSFFALLNRCPHQGGPLCLGQISGFLHARVPGEFTYSRKGEILRCPWHGWEFDIKTGQSWFDPIKTRVRSYKIAIETQKTLDVVSNKGPVSRKPGPYRAETYSVTLEQKCVVVEIP